VFVNTRVQHTLYPA